MQRGGGVPPPPAMQAQLDTRNPQLSINQHLTNFISKTREQTRNLAPRRVCLRLQLISMAAGCGSTAEERKKEE